MFEKMLGRWKESFLNGKKTWPVTRKKAERSKRAWGE
jgi:hypothetical protein